MSDTYTRTRTRKPRRQRGGSWTPVFDYLLALLGIFLILAITQKPPKPTPAKIDTLGVYAVVITWQEGSEDDVDLWVEDPALRKVWFGSQDEGLMHLDFDDLGSDDIDGVAVTSNGERVIIRGMIPGEYTVNVHMYSKVGSEPARVTCELWRLRGDDKRVVRKKTILARNRQEETCFRFSLTTDGGATGINTLPKQFVGVATG